MAGDDAEGLFGAVEAAEREGAGRGGDEEEFGFTSIRLLTRILGGRDTKTSCDHIVANHADALRQQCPFEMDWTVPLAVR